ncbi:MAG: ATP:cob(I)alamin adenosyltransferase [Candidatus Lloydbacteria bacterium RIFCSPLOWO2_01_FULL_50_20]|uniref:Corrinoid adenosyltransferase n=1 Tax=Candidatus Lloydbacteria bacterium RIFCSPLOWO2_01_FULL_50_20 TaxID=1798665 RepID=A0A1G2DJM1_9BACT|nr:MAG: ATP:cob(I)alamin adenosyltransferase [Candidatus Lloydbacteria bacterium RIFCSPHIGHO2_02_FULL_50_11]OGZ13855.1 MAG: ATP:cob(I)alamin adenosyltransferase [Candidatus Lloydbacteria bacterium RIFCSPLOWO2_01_FULL_50_20]
MLFTGKGDNGTTKIFGCDQRMSKSSAIAEALGAVDEINSLLGVVKIKTCPEPVEGGGEKAAGNISFGDVINAVQQDLFIIQASLAGADKRVEKKHVAWIESLVNDIEKELPPITSFFVSGGTELAAFCDVARTVARRAERRVVEALEKEKTGKEELLAYMNRLSSLLYALARLANHRAGVKEEKPHY